MPEADVERLRALPGARIIDRSARMLVVECDDAALRQLVESLAGWVIAPEQSYAVPDTRKKIERPPQ